MPIHLVPYLLSSRTSASLIHPNTLFLVLSLVALVVLRRWSNGKDLIARLQLRAKEEEDAEEKALKEKERMGRAGDDAGRGVRRRQAERDLHGLTFLVVCNFTPTSLLLLSALSSRGAQLLLLLPVTSFHPTVLSSTLQYLQLLRDGTNNVLVYAEQCDMLDLTSIEAFCARWNEGEGGGGTGAGPAGGRAESGLGGMGNAGLSGDEAGAEGGGGAAARAPRRCDGIIFLPYTLKQLELSAAGEDRSGFRGQSLTLCEREMLGRFHLINSLLSTLMLLPPGRDIRILNWVSPWYAAGVRRFEEGERAAELSSGVDKEGSSASTSGTKSTSAKSRSKTKPGTPAASRPISPPQRSSAPLPVSISTSGAATLQFILLLHELQRRLLLLAEADPRPRNPLPGILSNDPTGAGGGARISSVDELVAGGTKGGKYPNINAVSICPGFERDGEVWQFIWPSTPSSGASSRGSNPPGLTAALLAWLRRAAILLLWPLLGLVLAKSPKSAADQFLWGLLAPLDVRGGCSWVEGVSASSSDEARDEAKAGGKPRTTAGAGAAAKKLPEEDEAGWRGIQPARVYREGRIVNVLPSISLVASSPTGAAPAAGSASEGEKGEKVKVPIPGPAAPPPWYSAESLLRRWDTWEGRVRRQREWERENPRMKLEEVLGEEE